jgi:hypothetical protein
MSDVILIGIPTPTFPHVHRYTFTQDGGALYQYDDDPPEELPPSSFLAFLRAYIERAERDDP